MLRPFLKEKNRNKVHILGCVWCVTLILCACVCVYACVCVCVCFVCGWKIVFFLSLLVLPVGWFYSFPKRYLYLMGTKIPGGGGESWGRLYLMLHCHHQNDSCIKMGTRAALKWTFLPPQFILGLDFVQVLNGNWMTKIVWCYSQCFTMATGWLKLFGVTISHSQWLLDD